MSVEADSCGFHGPIEHVANSLCLPIGTAGDSRTSSPYRRIPQRTEVTADQAHDLVMSGHALHFDVKMCAGFAGESGTKELIPIGVEKLWGIRQTQRVGDMFDRSAKYRCRRGNRLRLRIWGVRGSNPFGRAILNDYPRCTRAQKDGVGSKPACLNCPWAILSGFGGTRPDGTNPDFSRIHIVEMARGSANACELRGAHPPKPKPQTSESNSTIGFLYRWTIGTVSNPCPICRNFVSVRL